MAIRISQACFGVRIPINVLLHSFEGYSIFHVIKFLIKIIVNSGRKINLLAVTLYPIPFKLSLSKTIPQLKQSLVLHRSFFYATFY